MEVLDLAGLRALAQKINQGTATLNENVQKAAMAAHSASDKAGEAASDAQTALTKALQVTNSMSKLQDRLIVAEENAASATSMADTAKAAADRAYTSATQAKTAADNAQSVAEAANTTANSAKTTANGANTTAVNARTIANNAKTAAEQASADADEKFELMTQRMEELSAKLEDMTHRHFLPFAEIITLPATASIAQTGVAGGVNYDVAYDTRNKAFVARIRTSVSRIVPGESGTGNVIYAYGDCMVDYNTNDGSGTPWPQQLYMDSDNCLWCFRNDELVRVNNA